MFSVATIFLNTTGDSKQRYHSHYMGLPLLIDCLFP